MSTDTQKIAGCLDLTGGASRSQLYVPLIHEERVLGVLILESTEEAAYTESDQAFILQLATQAAVAVVNAELYSETQRRLGEQSILYQVSTRLVGNPELEDILQTAADTVGSVMQNAAAGVYLWDESTFTLHRPALCRLHAPRLPACLPKSAMPSSDRCARRCSKPDRCTCPPRKKIPASWWAAATSAAPWCFRWWSNSTGKG